MFELSLSWTIGCGLDSQGGMKRTPQWGDVERKLKLVQQSGGSVTIGIIDPPKLGPESLQLLCENGKYMLLLRQIGEEDDSVRTLTVPCEGDGEVWIGGYAWDPKTVTSDFSIVRKSFKEFVDCGNVSTEILN